MWSPSSKKGAVSVKKQLILQSITLLNLVRRMIDNPQIGTLQADENGENDEYDEYEQEEHGGFSMIHYYALFIGMLTVQSGLVLV